LNIDGNGQEMADQSKMTLWRPVSY